MLPFEDVVGPNPSIEEMRKVVGTDEARPYFPNYWTENPTMVVFQKIMTECWYQNPLSRLTVLRVKKTLANLLLDLQQQKKRQQQVVVS